MDTLIKKHKGKVFFILKSKNKLLKDGKIFLMMLWETKSLDNKKYIALSEKLNEIGRNLGGWRGKIEKENSLIHPRTREK